MDQKKIEVAAAAILDGEKVLAMQRSETMSLAGLWEFPGGKIEAGESPTEAVKREISEELEIEIELIDYVNKHNHQYDFGTVVLTVYTAKIISGSIRMLEHSDKKWLSADQLLSVQWAPADIPAVNRLIKKLS